MATRSAPRRLRLRHPRRDAVADEDHPVLLNVIYRMRRVVPRLEQMLGEAWWRSIHGATCGPVPSGCGSTCQHCGEMFERTAAHQKFCSKQCRVRAAHPENRCLTCGRKYRRKKLATRKAYCSTACKNAARYRRVAARPTSEYRKAQMRESKRELREMRRVQSRPCEHCGRDMVRPRRDRQFCSTRCGVRHRASAARMALRRGAIGPARIPSADDAMPAWLQPA